MGFLPEFLTKEHRLERKKATLQKRIKHLDMVKEVKKLEKEIEEKEKAINETIDGNS